MMALERVPADIRKQGGVARMTDPKVQYILFYFFLIVKNYNNNDLLRFWETAHLPLPQTNINTYFSLRAKCWCRGGVGGQFPRNVK